MKPGPAPLDYSLDFKTTDFRQRPDLYRIGRGEQGVLLVEPYKGELLPHWRFKTVAEAKKSSSKIYKLFLAYLKVEDFPGADMARKFLQMGWTRARRYANHKGGRKYDKKTGKQLPRTEDEPDRLRITLAVAGFSREQLEITLEENQLTIRGRQSDDKNRQFLHRGIAARQFQRSFLLADGMQVLGADLSNGLLAIDLVRPEPERLIRRIDIMSRE